MRRPRGCWAAVPSTWSLTEHRSVGLGYPSWPLSEAGAATRIGSRAAAASSRHSSARTHRCCGSSVAVLSLAATFERRVLVGPRTPSLALGWGWWPGGSLDQLR